MIRYRFPLFSGLTNSQNETIGLDSKYFFSPNLILLIMQKEAALGLLHKNAAPAIAPIFFLRCQSVWKLRSCTMITCRQIPALDTDDSWLCVPGDNGLRNVADRQKNKRLQSGFTENQ